MLRKADAGDPHILWAPLVATLVTLLAGVLGLLSHQLLLFPSLAPTAVMQAHAPRHKSSRLYNVLVSQCVGMSAGYMAVAVFGLTRAPSVFVVQALSGDRVLAAALAILVGTFVELLLKAAHPPAAATTLLVALGSFRFAWRDVGWLVAGVLIVGVVGETARQLRLRYDLGSRGDC